jgi:hypothetical protein
MTNELQADVQTKLYRALGDRGNVANAATSSSAAASGRTTAQSPKAATEGGHDDSSAEDVYGVGMDPALAKYIEYDDGGEDFGDESDWRDYDEMMMLDGQSILLQELDNGGTGEMVDEWECATCTLINPPLALACTVCSMPRSQ